MYEYLRGEGSEEHLADSGCNTRFPAPIDCALWITDQSVWEPLEARVRVHTHPAPFPLIPADPRPGKRSRDYPR